MFVGGFLAGVATTVLVGRTVPFVRDRVRRRPASISELDPTPRRQSTPMLDHVVVRTRDAEHTRRSVAFWGDVFGFESERTDEAMAYLSEPSANRVAFPSVRINDDTVLDLFPPEMMTRGYGCRETPPENVVDHICLSLPGEQLLEALGRFKESGVAVVKVVGGLKPKSTGAEAEANAAAASSGGAASEDSEKGAEESEGTKTAPKSKTEETELFGPWGARGRGISVYFHEPNGLYCEVRTYDAEYAGRILERAVLLQEDEECPV